MNKPMITLDFDGVIHSYATGWHGVNVIADFPTHNAIQQLKEYVQYADIAIMSTRCNEPAGVAAMKRWIYDFCWPNEAAGHTLVEQLQFVSNKPYQSIVFLDDRAIQCRGELPPIESLLTFMPYQFDDGHMALTHFIAEVTMSDQSVWEVPVDLIARHRAKEYAGEFENLLIKSLEEDTIPLFNESPDEIYHWAKNNMDWSDVMDVAMRKTVIDAGIDYDEGWATGKMDIR